MFSHMTAHSSYEPKSSTTRYTSHTIQHTLSKNLPSLEYLRNDSLMQAELDRRLGYYRDFSRDDNSGMLHQIKLRYYRLGGQRVKNMVHWPQEFAQWGRTYSAHPQQYFHISMGVEVFFHMHSKRSRLTNKDIYPAISR